MNIILKIFIFINLEFKKFYLICKLKNKSIFIKKNYNKIFKIGFCENKLKNILNIQISIMNVRLIRISYCYHY